MKKSTFGSEKNDAISDAERVAARFDFDAARAASERWFAANGRDFPWRSDATPYRVWISESMLQQTTTQTVVGYFERFLKRFPDVVALASADESDVLKYWEGLGYYRRAKSLRAAAIEIVERFGGDFPENFDEVFALSGVGRYTAGAILSFGFDRRAPILEANTVRLHSRLLALRAETTSAAAQRLLWRFAENWLPDETQGRAPNLFRRLNAALIDLGRLVCAPSEPNCDACPLAESCESRRLGTQNDAPVLKKPSEKIARTDVAFWIERGELFDVSDRDCGDSTARSDDVLLIRRPENALWAGLWDFPRFEITNPDFFDATDFSGDSILADRLQLFLEEEVGAVPFDYRPGKTVRTIKHAVTKYKITLRFCRLAGVSPVETSLFDAFEVAASKRSKIEKEEERSVQTAAKEKNARASTLPAEKCVAAEIRWVSRGDLDAYPLSSTGRKLAKYLVETRR